MTDHPGEIDLANHARNWDALGKADPLWAICSEPGKENNQWDPDEFFETGRRFAADLLGYLNSLHIDVRRGSALDFGCGAGRITQALCEYFDSCAGVDIAESMIGLAERNNRYPDRCSYYLNPALGLPMFEDGDFDFTLANIVLQHMSPRHGLTYVAEMARVTAPDGVLYLQAPLRPKRGVEAPPPGPLEETPRIDMHAYDIGDIVRTLDEAGCELQFAVRDVASGPRWLSYHYIAIKR